MRETRQNEVTQDMAMEGFDIEKAKMFADIHTVSRNTTVPGMNDNQPVTEQLVPIETINFILDQLEHHYVPEKFI